MNGQWMPPQFPMPQQQMNPPSPMAPGVGAPAPTAQAPSPDGGDFSDLDPQALARLADLYGIPYEEAATMLRMKRAEALAGHETPKGRQVGDVFVASNPLEMAASGIQKYMGMKGMMQGEDQMRALGRRKAQDAYSQYEMYGAPPMSF